ncbi:MAG: transcription termination factor NusA [Oscillospiraceae bacterium]|nr:transcription termination factor NusA [Oscillospiraceae bacterium]
MKAIDLKEMLAAMEELEKERGIDKDYLLEALETALVTAYKRNFDQEENVKVEMDRASGQIKVYSVREIVKEVDDDLLQISLEEAKKLNKKAKAGETIDLEIIPKDFGRIAAQTAKQVIIQKIREVERNMVFDEYNDRKGEIVSGIIQKAEGGTLVIDLGKLEGIMLVKDQIPTEHYAVNKKVKAYVVNVEKGIKGNPQVFVSRSHPDFVRKLFEFEIPEIYEQLIEIKSVSRDPGYRSKVAVYSTNENIDPVGSCVGQKGIRIQNIINELNGEKIDVIEWDEDPATFISAALLPAQVMAVDIKEEERFAQVIVPDDQLSLAIGKAGQNARLAAKLTSWKIDIKSESQFRELLQQAQEEDEEVLEVIEEITEEEVANVAEEVTDEEETETNEVEVAEEEVVEEKKKTTAKKDTAKKATTKKAAAKKDTAEKATTKKAAAKKDTAEKATTKKAAAKKDTAKKTTTKKATTKKEDSEKATTKKAATKKTTTKSKSKE